MLVFSLVFLLTVKDSPDFLQSYRLKLGISDVPCPPVYSRGLSRSASGPRGTPNGSAQCLPHRVQLVCKEAPAQSKVFRGKVTGWGSKVICQEDGRDS